MTGFGDYDPDDGYDPNEPADPEQVAIKLHRLRLARGGLEYDEWNDLDDQMRAVRIAVIAELLDWLRRQGSLR